MKHKRKKTFLIADIVLLIIFMYCSINPIHVSANSQTGYVTASTLNVRTGPGTNYPKIATLSSGDSISIISSAKDTSNALWYEIAFTFGGTTKNGYISASYVTLSSSTSDSEFEAELTAQGFPESYKVKLRALHSAYPNWKFVAKKVNLNWADALSSENTLGKNLVPGSSDNSWKSIQPGAYDTTNDTWRCLDGSWVAASEEITAYYLDPRNFLSDKSIFQFKKLDYTSGSEILSGVESILNGTFMSNTSYTYTDSDVKKTITYGETFMKAAETLGINPYNIAARTRQEQGVSGTELAFGTVPDTSQYKLKGYFNFFNIGAYDHNNLTALQNGALYASGSNSTYYLPWTSPYTSILGGSKIIKSQYIDRGQNTLYFQKFNVVNSSDGYYSHQYMTNVTAAASEATSLSSAYTGTYRQSELEFDIPVYNNIPSISTAEPVDDTSSVSYSSHVQNIGWQNYVSDGITSGTAGQSLRIEAIKIKVSSNSNIGIKYSSQVQGIGWQSYVSNDAISGTTGQSKRLEAIKIELTGADADKYDIYYRAHVQNYGWLSWTKNGNPAGSEGLSLRLEAIRIKIVPKATNLGVDTSKPFIKASISYRSHIQNIGWQGYVSNGALSGTIGKSLRLEAINIALGSTMPSGNVVYSSYVQNTGWQSYASNGALSGTIGQSSRIEAIKIYLSGDVLNKFDIYYRVHVQNIGWMDWAKNGQSAGTNGYSYRIEAIEIQLIQKGGAAPGKTSKPFMQK